jgi:hypothetical protein
MDTDQQPSNPLSFFRFSWMNCHNVTNTVAPVFDKIVYLLYIIMDQDLFADGRVYVETPS